ncbi:Family T1, proteasome alpha subunit, threonine peptidase [Tritrichomonas foetus]|uniref:20S proteasome subunit alpha 6 n=1 Tax=Tritrichomonas foetus TaxID=1144522 RepID=A0A075KK24_9EUKA|nr:20S proteasome subunit alpha 6 [Tritrichomonas foetus]OHT15662.1 Family T1, proteasome alpha subunit, threonine peptidase [Tritrichomonas foetus]|eukprot:OHT15662.1 Family T1, proteasome alpha subunit, threonine peptidase [Tritrichomonas foetus]
MFRSRYDGDTTTFSPEGRLLQVENAMKAVQQGMSTVGIRSQTHAVIACIMHSPSEFSSFQPKIFKIDEHIGVTISGLTADGRGLCKMLRSECLRHKFVYGTESKVSTLADFIADRSQNKTQKVGKRPYGVGLLMIGANPADGPRLFETCPSGQNYEYDAQSIGRRSQAAKTYLEQNLPEFHNSTRDELIKHALKALFDCRAKEENGLECFAVGVVGVDEPFMIIEGDALRPYFSE